MTQENKIIVINAAGGLGNFPKNKDTTILREEMNSEISGKQVTVIHGWTTKNFRKKLRRKFGCTTEYRASLDVRSFKPGDILYWAVTDRIVWRYEFTS